MRLKLGVILVALAALGAAADVGAGTAKKGRLVVSQSFDYSEGMPIEGSVSYLEARRRRDGKVIKRIRFTGERTVARKLRRGRYRLVSYQHYCSANCQQGESDDASDRCSAPFRLMRGGEVRADVLVKPGKGCTIDFD